MVRSTPPHPRPSELQERSCAKFHLCRAPTWELCRLGPRPCSLPAFHPLPLRPPTSHLLPAPVPRVTVPHHTCLPRRVPGPTSAACCSRPFVKAQLTSFTPPPPAPPPPLLARRDLIPMGLCSSYSLLSSAPSPPDHPPTHPGKGDPKRPRGQEDCGQPRGTVRTAWGREQRPAGKGAPILEHGRRSHRALGSHRGFL